MGRLSPDTVGYCPMTSWWWEKPKRASRSAEYSRPPRSLPNASYTNSQPSLVTVPMRMGMSSAAPPTNAFQGCCGSSSVPAVGVHGTKSSRSLERSVRMSWDVPSCAARSAVAETPRRHDASSTEQPAFLASVLATSFHVSAVRNGMPNGSDSRMARWKRPLERGDVMWDAMLIAPALCPNSVTELGSPPNAAMFCCTNLNARRWSWRP
mmetsp:Transcript_40546/g.53191  ORF Transcript_40546/g.53191 Transcript_40546/m.53191 type:complete len:209 (-) Transcript_40546:38-664(-)